MGNRECTIMRSNVSIDADINPLAAKLFNLNFHPLEVVSRWRDPQLQVSENYSDLTKWRSTLFKFCWLMSHFIFNIFKILKVLIKMKTRIYAAPAVKGLKPSEAELRVANNLFRQHMSWRESSETTKQHYHTFISRSRICQFLKWQIQPFEPR